MKGTLCSEALEVGAMVRDHITAKGGVDVLRRCVADPSQRRHVGEALGELGIWDIDLSSGAMEFEVAAEVCRGAGHFALPYPVAERLGASGADATALVGRNGLRVINHRDLELEWNALDLEGRRYRFGPGDPVLLGTRLAPFGSEAEVVEEGGPAVKEAATLALLQSWWLLGLLENAVEDTARYASEREQFGRRLVQFQAVAFQLSDMALETEAAGELAKYALWSLANGTDPAEALVESLGLRVALQRAASVVLRGAHQIHGAMGFTDEVDVSWLSRASQSVRRLPEDSHSTSALFLAAVEAGGFPDFGQLAAVPVAPVASERKRI